MNARFLPFLLSLLPPAAGLAAQTETLPKGFLAAEGNDYSTPFGAKSYVSGFQTFLTQVDATLVGAGARTISTLRFRRDGTSATNTSAIGRTLTVEVRAANANWSKLKNSTNQLDSDWRVGSWSYVLAPRSIVLPDLRTAPASTPAPWAIQIPLDTPYSYSAVNALALQVHLMPNNLPSDDLAYVLDAYQGTPQVKAQGSSYGTACTMTGVAAPLSHVATITNYGDVGSTNSASLSVANAKPSTQFWYLLGTSDPNLAFGACANLRCSAELVVAGGSTNATGYGAAYLNFPHQAAYVGVPLRTQIVLPDPGKGAMPFALSNARLTTYPASPVFTKNVASGWLWMIGSGWSSNALLAKDSGLVIGI